MEPFTILGGSQAVARRFSFYITVQIASVLAPGIVVIAGSIIVIRMFQNQAAAQSTLAVVKELSGTAGLLTTFLLLAAGYVSGYVLRELAFKLLAQVEMLPGLRNKAQVNTLDKLEVYFSPDLIAECLSMHPILRENYDRLKVIKEAERPEGTESAHGPMVQRPQRAGGGHFNDLNYLSFAYAKLWVRNYAPGVSIDSMEAEINILVSGLAPSILVALGVVAAARSAWWSIVLAVAIIVLIWWVLLNSVIRLRRDERWESVRNLILDYFMRRAASRYPTIGVNGDDQAE